MSEENKGPPAPALSRSPNLDEAAQWMSARTGRPWNWQMLMEHGLRPYVWIDYDPNLPPVLFRDRHEGFRASFIFASDTERMMVDRTAKMTMTELPDGTIARFKNGGLAFRMDDLRFSRDALEALSERLAAQGVSARDPAIPSTDSASETPGQRRQRISERHRELVANGDHAPTKRVAQEEGLSVGRIRQLMRAHEQAQTWPKGGTKGGT